MMAVAGVLISLAGRLSRKLVRFFGDNDSGTRVMLERILTVEEEHLSDMPDLLQARLAA